MKIVSAVLKIIGVCIASLSLQGCIVAAIGAGIGAVKYGNAKQSEAQAKCKESYNNYMALMIKSGKKAMSLEEYCKE